MIAGINGDFFLKAVEKLCKKFLAAFPADEQTLNYRQSHKFEEYFIKQESLYTYLYLGFIVMPPYSIERFSPNVFSLLLVCYLPLSHPHSYLFDGVIFRHAWYENLLIFNRFQHLHLIPHFRLYWKHLIQFSYTCLQLS